MGIRQAATCSECGFSLAGSVLQYDRFGCTRCGDEVTLCDTCRRVHSCRSCGHDTVKSISGVVLDVYVQPVFAY